MLSLSALFWIAVGAFALVGALRGWAREIVATSGLVLALFIINQFGFTILSLLGQTPAGLNDPTLAQRRQFYIYSLILMFLAFFSYQSPRLSGTLGARLRPRDTVQDKLLGAIVGGMNGYLIAGAIWAFLEFTNIGGTQWVQLAPGVPYPFDPMVIVRPAVGSTAANMVMRMPIPLLSPYLPYLMVLMFLFVIIVMI
ncbi:MAG: CvpA family protein [Anaerolineae bacterium]|nr:CvpA family protein [Anaerolineae bacterium]